MAVILGINAYHGDSSACLVIDGKLVCAIEEERIRRIKHWAGMPVESIKWCLEYAGVKMKDVDYIAIGRNPYAHITQKILRVLTKKPSFGFLKNRLSNAGNISGVKINICTALGIDESLFRAKIVKVEHHKAHLASSFFVSPFDNAVCISVDGFGDFVSSMRGLGNDNNIEVKDWVGYPHSLGIFYTAMTQFLGFPKYGDEYKVMGLSAMGKPVYLDEMRKIIRLKKNGLFELDTSFFIHDSKGIEMTWNEGEPSISSIYSDKMIKLFGNSRNKDEPITGHFQDMAASVQTMYEEAFFHFLNKSYRIFKNETLCLSGGCIQNSLANGKIFERTNFKNVYIPPAGYDAGTAIGSAFWVWNAILNKSRDFVMESPYWGPGFSGVEIEKILLKNNIKYEKFDDNEIARKTAKDIAEGKIIGWFQGRTEWGPRALGNRSIIVDPGNPKMKDILNERIKRRESFRPFAPSILEEYISDWFENSNPVPFMEKVYLIKPEKRKLIPAVTHVDGTGRLQTVSKKMNIKYYNLINEFYNLTGIPIVLNTSFNENEPIVNTPGEALDCFLRTKMDVLVIENYYVVSASKN